MSNTGDSERDFLNSLNQIQPESQSPLPSDEASNEEEKMFIKGRNYVGKTLDELKAKRFKTNTDLRIGLAFWAILLISSWLWKVGEILVNNHDKYCLSDTVIVALLTTTTANVIGIMIIVLKDLFNGKTE